MPADTTDAPLPATPAAAPDGPPSGSAGARVDDDAPAEDVLDSGPRGRGATERMCVATREVLPVAALIRFVAGPDRHVVPDLKARLPGRGAWVSARRDLVIRAVRKGALRRAFRDRVTVDPDLAEVTERLLERSVLDALAIAHKAGEVVAGTTKVEAAIASGRAIALIHARDAAPDGVRKIAAQAARRPDADDRPRPVFQSLDSAELDLALGRTNVIHAALLPGRAADAVLGRWRLLDTFRTCGPVTTRGDRQTAASSARD